MEAALTEGSRPRVLVVSDHDAAGEALTTYLQRHGFSVVARVGSPTAAADAAALLRPDVALIDGEVACGWRAVAAALEGTLARTRIALLSSYWGRGERVEATRSGIGALALKRISGDDLALQLRDLVA